MNAGQVDVSRLITHTFPLDDAVKGLTAFVNDKHTAIKAVMIGDDVSARG